MKAIDATILDFLVPKFAYIDGEFKYVDEATGNLIDDRTMTEYNKYFGLSGYDEDNGLDEWEDCGDE